METGECEYDEINIGDIRSMRNGLFMIWAQCPLVAAVKMVNNGKIKLGWSEARVELLEARAKQCFRCWEFGHTRNTCSSGTDRSALCFKCGKSDHLYKECTNELHCVLCAQKGIEANHRIDSFRCKAGKKPINTNASNLRPSRTQKGSILTEWRSVPISKYGSTDSAN